MKTVEVKNITHFVLKNEDIYNYLSKHQQRKLIKYQEIVNNGRKNSGKKYFNEYYICNKDEPYAKEVIDIILRGEFTNGKED